MTIRSNGLSVLLIDADDTLWENNVYYERVIRRIQDLLLPCGVDPHMFREHLNETERRSIPIHGYGTLNFTNSLVRACQDCAPPEVRESLGAQARQWGLELLEHPIDKIPHDLDFDPVQPSQPDQCFIQRGGRRQPRPVSH